VGTLSQLLETLDADAHRRGSQFESICHWYLENDPVYKIELRRVWRWNDWPGRWGADAGIDLVAKDQQDRLWAIQSKAYDSQYAVTKADVDSFLSESNRPEISYRLLIATTDRIGVRARRTMEAQEKQVGFIGLAELESSGLSWPRKPTDLRARPVRSKKPRPHQRVAVSAVMRGFESRDRGQLLMACGTGKTLVSLFAAERIESERTLVLVPSLSLLSQTLREWVTNSSVPFVPLAVCSDETVADRDAVVGTTSELAMPTTTDPEAIASFLRGQGRRVVFSTYQSSRQIATSFQLGRRVPSFDLVVADEAHRCSGRVSSQFATVLSQTAIPASRRLFMTATPRYFTGRVIREAQAADLEIASMDDHSVFGPVFHRLTFGEAISRDLLSDYQVVVVGVDDATYRNWVERGRLLTLDGVGVTDARTLAGQIGMVKAIRDHGLRRSITFHSRIKAAQVFARTLTEIIDWLPENERPSNVVWSDVVSGEMSAGARNVALRRLRELEPGTAGVLTNARCLSEGVDIPTLDGVAFIDPRRSEVDIVQAVGRAIRKTKDKTLGTIVIPVFVSADDDAAAIVENSAFNPVWEVLKALRSHDEDLSEQLDALRREIGRGVVAITLPSKIHLDLPATVTPDFASAFNIRVVETTTSSWEFWFGLLERYVEREGDSLVPIRWVEDSRQLGVWTSAQRVRHGRGLLSADRAARLEALPGWVWDPRDQAWEAGFEALQEYAARTGTARVPQKHVEGEIALGFWVNQQRFNRSLARQDLDKRQRLEQLPGWSWDPNREAWEAAFALLQGYVADVGSAVVIPPKTIYKDFPLGKWVQAQRKGWNLGRISGETAERFDAVNGWWWRKKSLQQEGLGKSKMTTAWQARFAALQEYVEEHGSAEDIPQSFTTPGGIGLYNWVAQQRVRYRRGRLSEEQVGMLDSVNGWTWDPLEVRWGQAFTALQQYVEREGNADVPRDHVEDGVSLGQWVMEQRRPNRPLSEIRKQRLDSLPGWRWQVRRRHRRRTHDNEEST
jgi:superfamily II DNA or RNA helicase